MQLKSQEMRKLAPELDPLRIGTGWTKEDLGKVQVMVESTYGDSHPGSGHLNILVEEVRKGIAEEGGFGARYNCTDICDGESQGTDGINYSLASREMIANMIEIHANATPFDAGVYLSSCDKGVPGNLMGLARVNIPSVFVPGGTMNAGPEMLTLEQLGMYSAKFERGEIDEEKLDWAKCNACPSCGACSFIGTASTMQIMAEALGLALPGTALMPATSPDLLDFAREAGRQAVRIAQMENMRPSDIVTMDSFENAILVHAAISGSTNCLLHLPAIAHEFGIEITGDTFDKLHRNARYLLDVRPAGRWPAECFYYAGGVPAIMDKAADEERICALAKRLVTSTGCVLLCGAGAAAGIAESAGSALVELGIRAVCPQKPETRAAYSALLGEGDTLFCIRSEGSRESAQQLTECIRTAKKGGAYTVFVCNEPCISAESEADCSICTTCESDIRRLLGYATSASLVAFTEALLALTARYAGRIPENAYRGRMQ